MVTDIDSVRSEPHPDIGRLLARDATLIIDLWSQRTRESFPATKRLHEAALRDNLPGLLQLIGEQLTSRDGSHRPHEGAAGQHGLERWEDGWSLSEVVNDYVLLRMVLLEYLEQALGRPLKSTEAMAINLALDDAISASIVSFVNGREAFIRRIETQRLADVAERDRRKDEFLATLAHELRNPLAAMASAAELARLSEPGDEVFDEAHEILLRQIRQMTRLVDDLLDVSRIARGSLEVRREFVDAAELGRQAAETMRPLFDVRSHTLHVEITPGPIWIHADSARVQQILTNILDNASKYTPSGGRITFIIQPQESLCTFRVQDNGIGMTEEQIPRVFDLFTRLEPLPNTKDRGLGIGLTLVRQLVELHGGSVTAQSDGPGKGTEVSVLLPMSEGPEEDLLRPAPNVAVSATGTITRAKQRVLVVEDHDDLAKVLATLVRRCGQDVRVVRDGPSVLRIAETFRPHVILLDIGLPGMSGFEVAARLRAQSQFDACRLVALTGYGQEEDAHRTRAAGFDHHLIKPVHFDTLEKVLNDMCDESDPNAAGA